jgi:hypothetical protein
MFAMLVSTFFNNPKIVEAGPIAALVFIFALLRNAERERTGILPASDLAPRYVARQVGISEQEAIQALQRCQEVDLLELDGESAFICGWDERWKRAALTVAERERKAAYRQRKAEKTEKADPRRRGRSRERADTDKRRVSMDKSMDKPGQGVWVPLNPPRSKGEEERADKIIAQIAAYTSNGYRTNDERDHVVKLLRAGHFDLHLEALAAYTCDDEGQGWLNREDNNGSHYMRAHCVPIRIFSEKNVREQLTAALAAVCNDDLSWDHNDLRARLKAFEAERAAKARKAG